MTVFHDENGNKRLDRLMGIPREGFGFSRNPKIRFGPPKFEAVDIEVGTSVAVTDIHLLYML